MHHKECMHRSTWTSQAFDHLLFMAALKKFVAFQAPLDISTIIKLGKKIVQDGFILVKDVLISTYLLYNKLCTS